MITIYLGKKYFFLHPYYQEPITYKGKDYNCIWTAFVAQKYNDELQNNFFLKNDLQTILTYEKFNPIKNSRWERNKYKLMYILYQLKFLKDKNSLDKLVSTQNEYINFCFSENEYYWGSYNNMGENKLGDILMTIREKEFKKRKHENIILQNQKIYSMT